MTEDKVKILFEGQLGVVDKVAILAESYQLFIG